MSFKIISEPSKAEASLNKTFRLRESMVNQLQSIADENNISFNFLITQMLQYALDNLEK